MKFKIAKAIAYAVLIWVVGFMWGSIVFMTPALKQTSRIPFVSSNPAISFPILFIWAILTYALTKSFLKAARDPASDGLKLGVVFVVINFVLDLVVLVFLLKTGFGYFVSLTVWTAYAMLVIVPWLTGRSVEKMK